MPTIHPQPHPSAPINVASADKNVPAVTGTSVISTILPPGKLGEGTGVEGASGSGIGVLGTSESFDAVVGRSNSNVHAGVAGHNLSPGGNGGIGVYGTGGQYAGQFDGTLQVNGDAYVTGTLNVGVDIILPAADCAEEFEIGSTAEIEPGTVMVLNNTGVLEASCRAYDKKVAGVISGAGPYRPGIILDRSRPSSTRLPLALVGKVYCKADAQYGGIEIGDMLTTSPTPGHAMKAGDPALAFGAVIGKALQRLPEGRGLVPILVALQ